MGYTTDLNIIDENPPIRDNFPGFPFPVNQVNPVIVPGETIEEAAKRMIQPGVVNNTAAATAPPAGQPAQNAAGVENAYLEPYLQLFSKYLTPPVNDEGRQRRLQNASVVNAIGNALTNVVNHLHARNAPIIPVNPQGVQFPLAEAERLRQEYVQQQDQYDRLKLGTMWNAVQMANQDKRADVATKQYNEQMQREEKWRNEDKEYRTREREAAQNFTKEQAQTEQGYRVAAYDRQFQNELSLLNKKYALEMEQIAKTLEAQGKDGSGVSKIAEKPFPVVYGNQTVVLPPEIYWDVMTRELNRMNKPIAEFVTSVDYNSTDNSANAIVTSSWNQYWEPVIGTDGKVSGFVPKGGDSSGTGQAGSWTGAHTQGSGNPQTNVPTYFN